MSAPGNPVLNLISFVVVQPWYQPPDYPDFSSFKYETGLTRRERVPLPTLPQHTPAAHASVKSASQ